MSLLAWNKLLNGQKIVVLDSQKLFNPKRNLKRFESEVVQNCKSFLEDPSIAVANYEGMIYDISNECLRPKPAITVGKVDSKQCNK